MVAFGQGFFISLSLILAIGAQNAFVLQCGLKRNYILPVVLFCALSDAGLILLGIFAFDFATNTLGPWLKSYQPLLFFVAAIWLVIYGAGHFYRLFKNRHDLTAYKEHRSQKSSQQSLKKTLLVCALLTYANPHVYLDTVLLIGSLSLSFLGEAKLYYTLGAITASILFFFSLGYVAQFLSPYMKSKRTWQVLDVVIGSILFYLGWKFFMMSNFFNVFMN